MAFTRTCPRSLFLATSGLCLALLSARCSSNADPPLTPSSGLDGASDAASTTDAAVPETSLDAGVPETPDAGSEDAADGTLPSDAAAAPDAPSGHDAAAASDANDASPPPYMPCPPAKTPCVIMPLGDSITAGYNSTTNGGYRLELLTRIRAANYDATFVGDNSSGPTTLNGEPFPQGNEGFIGYTIDDAPTLNPPRMGIAPLVPAALTKYSPNVVLLMIGTNDVGTANDLPNLPTRLAALLDVILADSPAALLIVAQILPLGDPTDTKDNSNAQTYNTAIAGLVTARADAGKHIAMVDMYSAMTANPSYATQLMNGIHPNDAGYVVVGDAWYAGLASHL